MIKNIFAAILHEDTFHTLRGTPFSKVPVFNHVEKEWAKSFFPLGGSQPTSLENPRGVY